MIIVEYESSQVVGLLPYSGTYLAIYLGKPKRGAKKMIAIGYIRVSTEEQSREGVSLEMQAAKIRQYAELNDLELSIILEDAGISAKNISGRPGFQKALEMLYSRKADALICWKLDRPFRSTQDALTVAERLNKQGRALISISEKLDTTSAIGEFFFTLMASLAQMERRLVGERTLAALAQKRAKGEKTGGSCPYGFDVDEDGKLVPKEREQRILSRINVLRTDGYSIRRIVRALEVEGFRTRKGSLFGKTQIEPILKVA